MPHTIYPSDPVDQEIVFSLEKFAQVLRNLLWDAGQQYKVSPIQLQFMLFIAQRNPSKCRLSVLAKEFGLTKATVSDSIRVLVEKKLIKKKIVDSDHRSQLLVLTSKGRSIAQQASGYSNKLTGPIIALSDNEKEVLLKALVFTLDQLKIPN